MLTFADSMVELYIRRYGFYMKDMYDILIVGSGPAGLTAGLYASRARLKVALLEKLSYGGQVLVTDTIENYPGVSEATGMDLANKFYNQAIKFGLDFVNAEAVKLEEDVYNEKNIFKLFDKEGNVYKALSLMIATGASWRKLGVPGEEKFQGRGVSYCATCDAPLYKDKEVVVVGGGNAAVEEAVFLTKFAKKLTLIHRRGMLRATKILQEEFLKKKNVDLKLESIITEIKGEKGVESVSIKNAKTGKAEKLNCQGVFVFIGLDPNVDLVKGVLKFDEHGHIITDEKMRTSKEGIFAAGDVRRKALRQVVTAASDGAIAAYCAEQYVRKVKGEEYK